MPLSGKYCKCANCDFMSTGYIFTWHKLNYVKIDSCLSSRKGWVYSLCLPMLQLALNVLKYSTCSAGCVFLANKNCVGLPLPCCSSLGLGIDWHRVTEDEKERGRETFVLYLLVSMCHCEECLGQTTLGRFYESCQSNQQVAYSSMSHRHVIKADNK